MVKAFADMSFVECLATVRSAPTASAFLTVPTPEELHAVYSRGYQGIRPDSVTSEERTKFRDFMATQARLYDVFPWAKDIGKGRACAAYLATLHYSPSFGGDEAQTRGSCTVHSTANAAEMDHGNDALFGETEYKGRLVKENIYRSRGFNQDGWSCQEPAHYIGPEGKGGLLYRRLYEGPNGEKIDFTNFSQATENWAGAGRSGVPSWLEEESRNNKAKWIIPIPSLEEYRDAIALGFGISVCSGYGYSDTTDQYGVAKRQGSWSHAMAHTAFNDTPWAYKTYNNIIGMIDQSWGRWNKQNGIPEGSPAMPVGGFYTVGNNIAGMLSGGDSYAVCGVYGWNRTGWEAFDTTAVLKHLRSSTVQDYYKHRQERSFELTEKALSGQFLTV